MKVVIVGGNAAGLKTAARLRRLDPDMEIVVFEQGEIISYAGCGLPYFLSGDVDSFDQLVETAWGDLKDPGFFRDAKNIDVRTGFRAVSLDRDSKTVKVEPTAGGNAEEIAYDFADERALAEEWDWKGLQKAVYKQFNFRMDLPDEDTMDGLTPEGLSRLIIDVCIKRYDEKETSIGEDDFRNLERIIMLQTVDNLWKDHLLR